MRIIKQGNPAKNEKTTLYSVSCPICGFEAELDPGESIIQCPYCKSLKLVFTIPLIDFNSKKKSPSKRFPDEYYHYSEEAGAIALSNQGVSQLIEKTIKLYRSSGCGYAFSSTGDTFVAVFQTDEEDIDTFLVMVSKDYYECDFVNGE